MRLRKHLRHEEGDETWIVAQPVIPIHLGPAFLGVDDLVEAARPLVPFGVRRCIGQAVADEYRTESALWMIPCKKESSEAAQGEAHRDRRPNSYRVEHGQCIVAKLPIRICGWINWTIGEPVAAWVKRDDLVVSSQGVDLGLPVPGMDDRPGWQQQDRGLAGAEGLVVDLDAGPLDVSGLVGLFRSQLSKPPRVRS